MPKIKDKKEYERVRRKRRKNKRKQDPQQERSDSGSLLVTNKRVRSTALVKGYLTRMAADEEYRSLGLQGILSIPAAMVDSTGLLGMALASDTVAPGIRRTYSFAAF